MDELKEVIISQDKNVRAEVEKLIKITQDSERERQKTLEEIRGLRDAYRK